MCRLFGFRSVIQSQVHRSLVSADNALLLQSSDHPDGWGVAYYQEGSPHLIKSASTAIDDHLFRRVSGIVSSQTVRMPWGVFRWKQRRKVFEHSLI